jgi:hypothetical protein
LVCAAETKQSETLSPEGDCPGSELDDWPFAEDRENLLAVSSVSGWLVDAGFAGRRIWARGGGVGWLSVAGLISAVCPDDGGGVVDGVPVAEGLSALKSEPAASADGADDWLPVAGAAATAGPAEEAVGVADDASVAEGLLATERQPAAAPTTRIASAARAATSR